MLTDWGLGDMGAFSRKNGNIENIFENNHLD